MVKGSNLISLLVGIVRKLLLTLFSLEFLGVGSSRFSKCTLPPSNTHIYKTIKQYNIMQLYLRLGEDSKCVKS